MVGIILISHYTLAESLKETVSLVVGEKKNLSALSLNKDDKVEDFSLKLQKEVERINEGDGVIIFADMFGGTPSNSSLAAFGDEENVEIITGFNMPLVIEAIMHSDKNIKELTDILMKRKEKTIINAKALLKNGR